MRKRARTGNDRDPLIEAAEYLGRQATYMPISTARANIKAVLEHVEEGSVVLTAHGRPHAAIVSYETLEILRGALIRFLVGAIGDSWDDAVKQARALPGEGGDVSEEDIDAFAAGAVREARRARAVRTGRTR
jgi:prevent-host-death family protein